MAELLDSGARRDFGTGAVRDVAEGKGRCDLLPLKILGDYFTRDGKPNELFYHIENYVRWGDTKELFCAMDEFNRWHWNNNRTMFLEVAKQYEDGARKYNDRNWENGIPVHVFIDSGVRHYLKFLRGDTDEPHDRAFIWNVLGAIWTHENKPELIDLPFADKPHTEPLTQEIKEEMFKPIPLKPYGVTAAFLNLEPKFDDEQYVSGLTDVAKGAEPIKGKYERLSDFELQDLICEKTLCDQCPILCECCEGLTEENIHTKRPAMLDYLNEQEGLEGKA